MAPSNQTCKAGRRYGPLRDVRVRVRIYRIRNGFYDNGAAVEIDEGS
jgi:hypothetical protein